MPRPLYPDSWQPWLPYFGIGNGTPHENRSIDVLCKRCIGGIGWNGDSLGEEDVDALACARSVIVAVCGMMTALFCVWRIAGLHTCSETGLLPRRSSRSDLEAGRRRNPTQPRLISPIRAILYYILFLHCVAGSFEWLFGWTTQLSLFLSYAKALELLVVCYFYLDVAAKMMHWSSTAGRRLCFSSLLLMFIYFTLFLIMGFLLSIEPWTDCHAPYWIWFSTGEVVCVQLMVVSFCLIARRMRRIAASRTAQKSQRTELFILFWVFETSSLADLGYHISLFLLADDQKGCSGIFDHDQLRYSMLKFPYDIISFLLPAWTILYVFRPASRTQAYDDLSTEQTSGASITLPPSAQVVVHRNFRRRYRPLNQGQGSFQYVPAPQQLRAIVLARERGEVGVRRVASAPAIPQLPRRQSVSRSLISSPLYPIPEEHRLTDEEYQNNSMDNLSTVPLTGEQH